MPKQVPVPGLGARAWERVEDGIFRELARGAPQAPRRSVWPRAVATAAGVVALAAAVLALIVLAPWSARPVAAVPSRFTTTTGPSRVSLGEATLAIDPESSLVVAGNDAAGVVAVIERGGCTFEVAPRRDRPPFQVVSADVRVSVIGTRFTVRRDGERTSVAVDHGVVEVEARGTSVRLSAGDSWASSAASLAPSAAPPATASALAPPAIESAPPPAAPPSAPARATTSAAATPSPRATYEEAARLERSDPPRAIALYEGLAARGGGWGQNALFALGRLHTARGERAAARARLTEYLARYPKGTNASDARDLLDRLK